MRIGFIVNEIKSEEGKFTTSRLGQTAVNRGHEVWVIGVGDLAYDPDGMIRARATSVPKERYGSSETYTADLKGKNRQAFSNGWQGLETFGRVTFVAVTQIEPNELEVLTDRLAQHFVDIYGAPTLDAAHPVAAQELEHAQDLCEDHEPNTLIAVSRELTEAGVNEQFRTIKTDDADISQFAIHGSLDD